MIQQQRHPPPTEQRIFSFISPHLSSHPQLLQISRTTSHQPPLHLPKPTTIMCSSDIFLGLLAILFPPIAVWVKSGICSADSLINIALCCLGFIPGLLHAWYIIAKYPEESSYYETIPQDSENGRVTYYYVSGQAQQAQGDPAQGSRGQWNQQGGQQQQRGYGTQGPMNAQSSQGGASGGVEGSGSAQGGVPPSYEQAVKGDHKVQT